MPVPRRYLKRDFKARGGSCRLQFCHGCGAILPKGWHYMMCERCSKRARCAHGNDPAECNDCYVASDFAYDARRS